MKHEAMLHIQWKVQQQTQPTTGFVDLTTIDLIIVYTQLIKHSLLPNALGVLQNASSENVDHDANQIPDTLIGMITSQALRCAVIGQYRDVMDIS